MIEICGTESKGLKYVEGNRKDRNMSEGIEKIEFYAGNRKDRNMSEGTERRALDLNGPILFNIRVHIHTGPILYNPSSRL